MKRTLLFTFFIILAASLIAVAIIYRVHWLFLVVIPVFLALFVAYIFLGMKFQELIEALIWPRGM